MAEKSVLLFPDVSGMFFRAAAVCGMFACRGALGFTYWRAVMFFGGAAGACDMGGRGAAVILKRFPVISAQLPFARSGRCEAPGYAFDVSQASAGLCPASAILAPSGAGLAFSSGGARCVGSSNAGPVWGPSFFIIMNIRGDSGNVQPERASESPNKIIALIENIRSKFQKRNLFASVIR